MQAILRQRKSLDDNLLEVQQKVHHLQEILAEINGELLWCQEIENVQAVQCASLRTSFLETIEESCNLVCKSVEHSYSNIKAMFADPKTTTKKQVDRNTCEIQQNFNANLDYRGGELRTEALATELGLSAQDDFYEVLNGGDCESDAEDKLLGAITSPIPWYQEIRKRRSGI